MDSDHFDDLTRLLSGPGSRRWLLGTAAGSLFGLGALPVVARNKNNNKKKKKKATLCLDGQTIQASKKKKKKLLKGGATPGACASPPPPVCTPVCAANSCGTDGCGGTCVCTGNFVCDAGVCQPCTVVCGSDSFACGQALTAALGTGGTVYACPGLYTGSFVLNKDVSLIGAGQGTDPSTSTILDPKGVNRVVDVAGTVTAALRGLRITGGEQQTEDGGGIRNAGSLTVSDCTITANRTISVSGGGIANLGTLTLIASAVTKNEALIGFGGGIANSGTVTLDSACSVTGNTATGASGGGGIHTNGGTVTLNGATVTGNSPDNCAPPGSVDGCSG